MAKVLIVEDEPSVATYLSELMISVGHSPIAVDSQERAMEMLQEESDIALLILDHHLGTHSGLEFLTAIRKSERYCNLPVIVCSGDTRPAAVTGFASLNIVGFVAKPFRPERMLADVERALAASASR